MTVEQGELRWTWNLGSGRVLVMERIFEGYRGALVGFRGDGTTQSAALDDLLAQMRDYGTASDDLTRSLTSGGQLSEKLRQIEQLVDQITQGLAVVSAHGGASID